MHYVRLIYTSQSSELADLKTLRSILKIARENNAKNGITGILCYDKKYFLQWIEGNRMHINQLYSNIIKDPRHTNITLLDYQEIHVRTFEKWSMAYFSLLKASETLLSKYFIGPSFNPYTFTAAGARDFLTEFSKANDEVLKGTFDENDFAY